MNRRMFLCAALALAILASAAPVAAQDRPVALVGGRVHTVSGEVIEPGVVVLGADGKIEGVGRRGALKVPPSAEVVDVRGKVVTPGLFDAHTTLGLVEIWAVHASRDVDSGGALVNASHRAADSFNPDSAVIPIQRPGGVTDVIIAPSGGVVSGQGAHVELGADGGFAAVRTPSVAQYVRPGHGAAKRLGGSRGTVWGALRELYDDVNFYLDNRRLFDENRSRALSASRLSLAALGETLAGAKPVVFAVSRASEIRRALAFAEAQTLRPVILGGHEAWRLAGELAAAKAPVIVDPLANLPSNFSRLATRADNAALLERAGVPVILSTFESHNVRKLRQLAGNAVRAGMSPDGALRAVTLTPAEAFGLGATHGSLDPGKVANVVVWSGDPFELSTRVERMYVRSRPVDVDGHRQQKLFERYRALERRGEPAEE